MHISPTILRQELIFCGFTSKVPHSGQYSDMVDPKVAKHKNILREGCRSTATVGLQLLTMYMDNNLVALAYSLLRSGFFV